MSSEYTSIGNYIIVDYIAKGGFSSVYMGRHMLFTNRIVAIKLLHWEHLTSQRERDRFLQEALHLEQLKHPHIVSVVDAGFHDSVPYIVTAYLPNGSLQDRLARQLSNPLPSEEVLSILSQIGQALQAVHQQNIIHRDLKPANILFNAEGKALLADFGIATALISASIGQMTTLIGTLTYMAPEQFQGIISKEGDQYALACIAYELFTGRVPFRGRDLATLMYQHLYETPMSPRQLNPDLPVHIEQALLKALAKERIDRYPDITAFLSALQTPLFQRNDLLAPTRCLPHYKRTTLEHLDETTLDHTHVLANHAETRRKDVQEQQMLETIFGALHNGVITIDASGIITTWNTAASRILLLNPQAVLSKHYQDVFGVSPYTYLSLLLHDALSPQTDSMMGSHSVNWTLDGKLVNLCFTVSALDTSSNSSGLVLVIEDRTEQECLQAQAQDLRDILELYLSPDVVEQFLHKPYTLRIGGEKQEISVIFADIRNFTQLSEHLTPEQLTDVLNTYFEVMVKAIWEEEGTVTGFQGDGLMAIFNAPLSQPDHALRAVRAAWKMRRGVFAYQQTHQEDFPITFGVGVNTGPAMVGNFGARGLIQNYTAVGDTVNIAARLQAHAADNTIILHHSTFTRVRRAVKVDLLALKVKNKIKPLDAWRLQDLFEV